MAQEEGEAEGLNLVPVLLFVQQSFMSNNHARLIRTPTAPGT
jgi:hypothetical protein